MHRTPRFRSLFALGAVTALLLVGCSSSGGDDDAGTTTEAKTSTTARSGDETTTAPDDETTTAPDDETSTTEAADPGDGPTSADLEALLPTAADIGDGFADDTSADDSDGSATEAAIEEQCPEAAALSNGDDDADKVEAAFAKDDGTSFSVRLNPTAEEVSSDDLDGLVEAIGKCTVTFTDPDQEITTTLAFQAEADSDYGDQGVRIQATATLEGGPLPQAIELNLYVLSFRHGVVGVSIQASDGIDETKFEAIPLDTDILLTQAEDLDTKVGDLVD